MPTPRRLAQLALLLVTVATGCASRRIDALAPIAAAAPYETVTLALDGDPPLPGEPTSGWIGLGEAPATDLVLDAETAVGLALAHNPRLDAADRRVEAARMWQRQAGRLPNPSAALEGLPGDAEVSVELPVTDLLLAPARAGVLAAEVDAERVRARATEAQLVYEVRVALTAAQVAEQQLAVAQRALDGFAAARDLALALGEAGNTAALDVVTRVAAYESARIGVAELELRRVEARERLAALLGDEAPRDWAVAPLALAPEVAPTELQEEVVLAASLELAERRARLTGTSRAAGLAAAEGWLPDLAVAVHGSQEGGEDWHLGPAVHLTVPLFDRRGAERRALLHTVDAELASYRDAANTLRSEARQARYGLQSAWTRARHLQEVVLPRQQEQTRETLLQYNAMQVGVYELLGAQRLQLDAELAHVAALGELWTAAAAVDLLRHGGRPAGAREPSLVRMTGAAAPDGGH